MGPPSVGDVVIIPFPYSDLTQSKRRPALVLAEVGKGDSYALPLNESDFVSGGIKRDSFIRGFKLFTGSEALMLGVAGHLTHAKLSEVIGQLVDMLSACLSDDTF
jgi:mRNA interferase MazF